MDDKQSYEPVPVALIPRDIQGNCAVNLYVYLPTPKKFILFVPAGEKFTLARKMALERHIVPALFMKVQAGVPEVVVAPEGGDDSSSEYEVMGAAGAAYMKAIFERLSTEGGDTTQAVKELEKSAEDIIKIVAPDVDDLRARILKNTENIWVMNDASAIITIAVMFAYANGFDSPKPLRDLVYASLVMDLPLIALGPENVEAAYVNLDSLPSSVIEKYRSHPLESYRIAKQSLRYFTETALQLVLNHHEYKNGMGWPRKIRTESLFPLAKVFSAAVDTFERMKKSQLQGRPLSLVEAVTALFENDVELHLRRHNREIVDKTLELMQSGRGFEKKAA
jgi:hypothetical protein